MSNNVSNNQSVDVSDYVARAGPAALGGRIRRLSERLDGDAGRVYKAQRMKFEQRWFGVINQLSIHGSLTVTELAEILRIRHASVSQTRSSLERAGLVRGIRDPNDGRRRAILLTAKGKNLVAQMRPIWDALSAASVELDEEAKQVSAALARLESAMARKSLFERALELLEQ